MFKNILHDVFSCLPLLVLGAEQLHGPGNGPQKREEVIRSVFSLLGSVIPPARAEAVRSAVGQAIDGTVAVLNAAHALQPDGPAPALPTA